MKERKETKISYFAAHITTIVSITLVLLIVGIIGIVGIAASNAGEHVRRQIELSVIMQDSVTNDEARQLAAELQKRPYAAQTKLISKEQALKDWQRQTGENLEEVFGVNPLSPEVSISLKPQYATSDSVKAITARLQMLPGVEEVAEPDTEVVGVMNRNIKSVSMVLGAIAVALICISFVLINNTVHLSIYSRRFSIHTMQLVGATNGFIRRPFIVNSLLSGLIAATVACLILFGGYECLYNVGFQSLSEFVSMFELALVVSGLFLFGALMCSVAALFATNKYLRMRYDELFK